ncbi:PREDICTED: 5'-AMP-activated protein kinase subunit gamma-1-like isoform X2 [Amphimedon queenslandica]|uniref:CBS domain-containing protein n=1 Tax=Amphimedon queenslandica TaxID=400682 RepID=A0A1X7VQN9_AMPQE|nr:PREDICTED: 5'-AMP-activated protein kinase subunit gamma-1-like isoform X2 [Amphimedon queenslandica]|eukprot:XP_019857328.1 PREDICTED: 5'-AMP-activated protein kinase subunit gamma-1-like isoform X2 [Amphimedon queenslandica]
MEGAVTIREDPDKASSDEGIDATGESSYSTAPSSPEPKESDTFTEVNSEGRDTPVTPISSDQPRPYSDLQNSLLPKLTKMSQSPPVPKHVGSNKTRVGGASGGYSPLVKPGGEPEIVTVRPYNVQVGFNAPQRSPSLETTDPSTLPGTANVITSPPKPHPRSPGSKPVSIEELDKARRHYAPPGRGEGKGRGGGERSKSLDYDGHTKPSELNGSSFCLGLPSFRDYVPASTSNGETMYLRDEDGEGGWSVIESKPRSLSFDMKDVFRETETEKPSSEELYSKFLKSHTCYDLIPESTKVVVFDTKLKVKKAFYALVINGVRSAPLWDSNNNKFVGMLTITDFINILKTYYKSPIVGMDELEEQTIQTWREATIAKVTSTLVQIDPMESLYEAVKILVENKIHRLPIIDQRSGNSLFIATHKRILHFMYFNLLHEKQPSYMSQSLEELGIGSYKDIATVTSDTPIITALNKFTERRVSALPIVDSFGKVTDIYAKFDVINLAAERTYNNLDVSLRDALKHRAQGFEGVLTCLPSDKLGVIIKKIVESKVHRLVIVNTDRHAIGVLSLSDILRFLVLTPHSK